MSRLFTVFIVVILVTAGLAITANPVNAVTVFPAGFVSEAVVTNLTGPTTITFAPDGRMFIGQKDGAVRVFQNGVLLPTIFIDLSAEVNTYWDRGLMGVAVHPDFPTIPYVYLLYTYDPPGATPDGSGARVSRLLRVTADPDTNTAVPNSEIILLGTNSTFNNIGDPNSNNSVLASCENSGVYVQDCIASDGPSHTVGTLVFGTDKSLFVSSGDSAHFFSADVRALRALNPDSLNGKILHIDPITGEGYPTNPFYDSSHPNNNRSKVYSLGLRNPFRIAINALTNEPFIGDVGWGSWEEVNTGWGENFGWPCYEGNDVGSAEQGSYKYNSATSAACNALYAQGLSAVQAPLHSYGHASGGDSAIIVGGFYQGIVYPSVYEGALFFSDYNADSMRYLTFDGNGNATAFAFGTDVSPVGGVVQLLVGQDTNLYYVAYNGPVPNTSEVRRIRYTAGGNTPPTANASADPDSGLLPLTVNFSSAGSFDPDVQTLTYAWNFGDGGTSTDPNPSHEYSLAGTFTASLTVTDSQDSTGSDTVVINAGNLRPVATIISPTNGFSYNTGTTINYSSTGVDHEDGSLGGASLQWDILLHHGQHIHFDFMPGLTGTSGSFSVPDHGDNTWIELCLTVTDNSGLTDQDCVNLQPNTVTLSFDTVPSGFELEYEGVSYFTPFDVTTNVNSARDLIAPLSQNCNIFAFWSDGGAATHSITTSAVPHTYTATYVPCTLTGSAGAGGTITPAGIMTVVDGENRAFSSAPNATFILSDVLVDGVSAGRANNYTFNNITSSHSIAASFNGGWFAPTASIAVNGVTNPSNVFTSNDANAVFNSVGNTVNYTTFDIHPIPVGAMINGIEVAIEGYNGPTVGRNAQIQISWNGGTTLTTVTVARTTALLATGSTVILGGPADTWGRTWSNTEFTNANFMVKATSTGGAFSPMNIDQLQVKVSYTVPAIPRKVVLRSPGSNILTTNNLPTFWWTNVKGGQTYKIEFATDNGFTSVVGSEIVNGSPYTVVAPFSDGKYYWRVRANNVSNQPGAWSSARTFTIDTTGPAAPTLSSPADNASTRRTLSFKWLRVPTAVTYEFQYDNNADFSSPTYSVTVRGTFRRPPAMKNGTYYWRVRAKDAAGNWSAWSVPSTINIIGH